MDGQQSSAWSGAGVDWEFRLVLHLDRVLAALRLLEPTLRGGRSGYAYESLSSICTGNTAAAASWKDESWSCYVNGSGSVLKAVVSLCLVQPQLHVPQATCLVSICLTRQSKCLRGSADMQMRNE